MAIIFGWGGGTPRDRGAALPVRCPNCNNDVFFRYITSTKWFRLYFIPLIPYDPRHLLVCPTCTRGVELDRPARDRVKRMVELTALWTSDRLTDDEYGNALASFHRDELPQLPSTQALHRTGADTTSIMAARTAPVERSAPSLIHRPCPSCNAGVPAGATVCPTCGADSAPWTFHGGHWWTRNTTGELFWLDADSTRWVKYEPRVVPDPPD